MKIRIVITTLSLVLFSIFTAGCQKTPDKSAVVSKAGGLNEDTIIEPIKKGEKQKTDIPEHWQMNEKKNNNRTISRYRKCHERGC